MANSKVKRESDINHQNIQQIIEIHTKLRPEDEIEREIQNAIVRYLESLGLPKGNKGRIDCTVDIYDNYQKLNLHVMVLNWHKSCGRCPDTYKIESTLDADTELSNMKPEDFKFCVGLPLNQQICIDGETLIDIIIVLL